MFDKDCGVPYNSIFFHDEVAAFKQVGPHPNLVRVYESHAEAWATDANQVAFRVAYIVQEYLPKGEVLDHVLTNNFSEELTRYCAKECLLTLSHIHSRGVVHLDMKLDNLLLDADCKLKICDFGFAQNSKGVDATGLQRRFVGTAAYMMPEVD